MTPDSEGRPARRRARQPFRRPLSPMWFAAAVVGLLLGLNVLSAVLSRGKTLDYSDFKSLVAQNTIIEIEIGKDTIRGRYQAGDGAPVAFNTIRVDDPE